MCKTPHVAVFSFPFGSHAAPLFSLVCKVAESAPGVKFSFFNTAKSNALLPSDSSPGNVKLYEVWNGVPEGYVFKGVPQEDIELFMNATPGNFEKGLGEVGEVNCVLSDAFLWFAGDMAEKMGVPWVSLWAAGACSMSAHFYTDHLRHTVGIGPDAIPAKQDQLLDSIPGLSLFRGRDLPDGIVAGRMESLFSCLLHRMAKEAPRAAAVVLNTVDDLERAIIDDLKTKFRRCLALGPLTLWAPQAPKVDVHDCLAWLDRLGEKHASAAYVSFGTAMSPPPTELAALAEGLEASEAYFIWSLKESLLPNLPKGFLERIKGRGLVVPWVPQTMVLEHGAVGAFLTHCGWNSVMESVSGGVPMICCPILGDQKLNARMVSHVWGIGVGVEGGILTKEGVVRAFDLVLRKEEGRKMRERIMGLKEAAIAAVGKGGSSTKNLEALVEIVSCHEK